MTPDARILPLPGSAAHVVTTPDGRRRVRLRTGRFAALDAPPIDLDDALSGSAADDSAADEPRAPASVEYLRRLSTELDERDAEDAERRWPRARRAVCLLGSGALLDDVERAFSAWGADITRRGTEDEPASGAALVVAYADEADARRGWSTHDRLPLRGVAWLRAYRDGECLLIDPISVAADDPTSAQVAARRIAASSSPDAAEVWQRMSPPATEPVDAAARALALARLLQIALAWARDDESLAELRTTLWKLVPAHGIVSEHTVLPYPEAPRRVIR